MCYSEADIAAVETVAVMDVLTPKLNFDALCRHKIDTLPLRVILLLAGVTINSKVQYLQRK